VQITPPFLPCSGAAGDSVKPGGGFAYVLGQLSLLKMMHWAAEMQDLAGEEIEKASFSESFVCHVKYVAKDLCYGFNNI
jgi:hypothetical protein